MVERVRTRSRTCKILALVVDDLTLSTDNKVKTGDWVTLTRYRQWKDGKCMYATDHSGSWGKLGRAYRPIINLETGERYAPVQDTGGGD